MCSHLYTIPVHVPSKTVKETSTLLPPDITPLRLRPEQVCRSVQRRINLCEQQERHRFEQLLHYCSSLRASTSICRELISSLDKGNWYYIATYAARNTHRIELYLIITV